MARVPLLLPKDFVTRCKTSSRPILYTLYLYLLRIYPSKGRLPYPHEYTHVASAARFRDPVTSLLCTYYVCTGKLEYRRVRKIYRQGAAL
jgi:hypothetical protein